MKSEWRNSHFDVYSLQAVKALVKEARLSKLWIKYKDTWYTPEELEAVAETAKFEHGRLFLRDPIVAVRAGKAHIDGLQQKLTDFNIKIAEYYRQRGR